MSEASEHDTDPQREMIYRRGYAHGAASLIGALCQKLSEEDRRTVQVWLAEKLTPWATAPDVSEPHPPKPPAL